MGAGTVRKLLGELNVGDHFWHRGKLFKVLHHVEFSDRVDWEFLEEDDGVSAEVDFSGTFVSCISAPRDLWFIMPKEALVSTENPYEQL